MVRRLRFLVVLCLLLFAGSTSTAIAAAIDLLPPMPPCVDARRWPAVTEAAV